MITEFFALDYSTLKYTIILLLTVFILSKFKKKKRKLSKEEIEKYIKNEQMKSRNTILLADFENQKHSLSRRGFTAPGVYIFTNLNNGRKYVGQSKNILNRVNTHIKGRGSEDLFLDIQRGNDFILQFVKLSETKHRNLNSLEKYYIKKMKAFTHGYNKTRGNS